MSQHDKDTCSLHRIMWSTTRSQGISSILILIALSLKLNLDKRGKEFNKNNKGLSAERVTATYDQLQDLTGLSRGAISHGLKLLIELKAIESEKKGRTRLYRLIDISIDGKWRQMPQNYLFDGSYETIRRLTKIPNFTKQTLNAMKLYVLFIERRTSSINEIRISYDKITEYSGIRREEIRPAISMLAALELAYVSVDSSGELDRGNKYKIKGLIYSQKSSKSKLPVPFVDPNTEK